MDQLVEVPDVTVARHRLRTKERQDNSAVETDGPWAQDTLARSGRWVSSVEGREGEAGPN